MYFSCVVSVTISGDLVGLQQALLQMEALGVKENMTSEINSSQKVQELQNDAQISYNKKDFRKVVYLMDRCLELCPAGEKYVSHVGFYFFIYFYFECVTFFFDFVDLNC